MADEVERLNEILVQDTDRKEKTRSADALVRIDDRYALDPLIIALHDPDSYVRQRAATALGNLKDTRAVEPLIEALQDTENSVFLLAAVSLGEIRDKRAIGPLIAATESNKDPFLRGSVMTALYKIYQSQSLESRLLFLGSPHSVLRDYAISTLAKLGFNNGYRQSFCHLIAIHVLHLFAYTLTDSAYTVRRGALWQLAEFAKDAESVGLLLPILKETEARERWAAIVLLGRMGDPRALDALHAIVQNDTSKIQKGKAVVYLKTAAAQAIKRIEAQIAL